MIWFTSDWFLGDPSIRSKFKRPFANTASMDHAIINNFNRSVKNGDVVWFLGNFCPGNEERVDYYFEQINPDFGKDVKIFLLRGHSDSESQAMNLLFDKFMRPYLDLNIDHYELALCNYPLKTWYKKRDYGIHLHGHHLDIWDDPNELSFDISVDANEFNPVSWPEIEARSKVRLLMKGQEKAGKNRKERRKNKHGIPILNNELEQLNKQSKRFVS